ncbi:hypothetical protein [Nocardiopsis chromatogenes]|uniref:hypothetical protein n=1 Tax=Nocardiopsis chromatogenes TaxID=280239 RepID=UPI000345554C|nr:hypothetical protein [Nocardiopsis chromatogenes]
MPSAEHELPLEFVRNNPEMTAVLLEEAYDFKIPDHDTARTVSGDCADLAPKDYRGDAVVCFSEDGDRDVFAVVFEVQRKPDQRKRFSWPVYHSTVRARLECPTALMVLCPDSATADWARFPIDTGHPEYALRPLVVGPTEIPVVTDPARAREQPELSALSALAHGGDNEGLAVLTAFAEALSALPEDRFPIYNDYVVNGLSEAARAHWEALMTSGTYTFKTEFARRHRESGFREGKTKGEAESLLAVLDARGFALTDEHHERIAACDDPALLLRWTTRAVTADSADEVFAS